MRISLNELVQEMNDKGYKITSHGVKYYVRKGLIPQPVKQGGYKEGVRLVFADKNKVLARLFKIFEMKGKGYKLAEIKEASKEEEKVRLEYERKKYLEGFIQRNGRFYHVLKREPEESWARSLEDVLQDPDSVSVYLHKTSFSESDSSEVLGRGLFIVSRLYNNKPLFTKDDIWKASAWIVLRRDYGIEWDSLEALHKKHTENFDKYFFWPEPDDVRFTRNFIGWRRQLELNDFAVLFKKYIERIITKTSFEFDIKFDFLGEVPIYWDYPYKDIGSLIQDFLAGKCAFVPSIDAHNFLKKF